MCLSATTGGFERCDGQVRVNQTGERRQRQNRTAFQMLIRSNVGSQALSPLRSARCKVSPLPPVLSFSLLLLFCFARPAVAPAQHESAPGTEERSRTLSALPTPRADSGAPTLPPSRPRSVPQRQADASLDVLDAANQEFVREAAFYEKDGKLEVTDTTLRFGNGAFSMDQARYQG